MLHRKRQSGIPNGVNHDFSARGLPLRLARAGCPFKRSPRECNIIQGIAVATTSGRGAWQGGISFWRRHWRRQPRRPAPRNRRRRAHPLRIFRASGYMPFPDSNHCHPAPRRWSTGHAARTAPAISSRLAGDYTNPILKPAAAAVVKKHGELGMAGIGDPESTQPVLAGRPTFRFYEWPNAAPATAGQGHDPLWLRSSGPPCAHEPNPSRSGDAVLVRRFRRPLRRRHAGHRHRGHQGRALFHGRLVWHAAHARRCTWSNAIGCSITTPRKRGSNGTQSSITSRPGMPIPNARGKYLQLRFTVEDKGVFTTPWTATMTYRNDPDDWVERPCAENIQWYPGQDADVPRASKPDF